MAVIYKNQGMLYFIENPLEIVVLEGCTVRVFHLLHVILYSSVFTAARVLSIKIYIKKSFRDLKLFLSICCYDALPYYSLILPYPIM